MYSALPAQTQRIPRINSVHEGQAAVAVGELVDLPHPISNDAFGGIVPGVLEGGSDPFVRDRGRLAAMIQGGKDPIPMLIQDRAI